MWQVPLAAAAGGRAGPGGQAEGPMGAGEGGGPGFGVTAVEAVGGREHGSGGGYILPVEPAWFADGWCMERGEGLERTQR